MARQVRLSDLAREAQLDADEALVRLWDAGLDDIEGPGDALSGSDVPKARRALGLAASRDIARTSYWRERLGVTEEELRMILADQGIKTSGRARNLPKGAVARLKRVAEERKRPAPPSRKLASVKRREPETPFEWRTIGREKFYRILTADELVSVHEALVDDFAASADPVEPPGVRDRHLVESAAMRPGTSLGGEQKYKSLELGAAALLHSLVNNHAFFNGNKRTGLVALLVMLDENDVMITCQEDELFKLVLRVAQHGMVPRHWSQLADREVLTIAQWIKSNTRAIDRAERLIKWRKLRQILNSHECELSYGNVGNRINIDRIVPKAGLFSKEKRLHVQVAYGDEGREVERDSLRHIRRKLELDEEHGFDSEIFYGGARAPSDFIVQYRKTLARLAKL